MPSIAPRLILVTVALAFARSPVSAAECVHPSADVVSAAVLRAAPTTSSSRAGLLRPGKSLPLLESAAGWYEVRTPNGQSAYVSKRWTDVATCDAVPATTVASGTPQPLLAADRPVEWWFVFKLNAARFPGCEGIEHRTCPFGGTPRTYAIGQQFVFASSEDRQLQKGSGCVGTTLKDPVGATFEEAYTGNFHFVVWNDEFKGDPRVSGCGADCASPWGHSKGMVVWDDGGAGFVLQVTTPSWPGAGNQQTPRQSDGNTLGCVIDDDVKYSQHFFSLKLTRDDLVAVLRALQNASVGTDPTNPQVVSTGGPAEVQAAVAQLGKRSSSTTATIGTLSSGVRLISKPSGLHVPPWQLVSSLLSGVPLRVATWWYTPRIASTTAATSVDCWEAGLSASGAVQVATSGQWHGTAFGLEGFVADGNHAKIGVSTDASSGYAIFGDLNQQGTLSDTNCGRSQNGRGGIFFVLHDADLAASVGDLIKGESAPAN